MCRENGSIEKNRRRPKRRAGTVKSVNLYHFCVHLVTGGSGFLGSLIARQLARSGERVRVLDLWDDPGRPREIEYFGCDIRDRAGVRAAMRGVQVVHHNAALVPLTKSGKGFWDVNVNGSAVAAEEAARAGVAAFVHMSSSAVFGVPQSCPITTQTPLCPIEIYGRSKLAGEERVRAICQSAKLPLFVIRPRTILAAGRLGIFQLLFEWISQSRAVYVIGDCGNAFQFVHAIDLMDAYMLVTKRGRPGNYNIGTDRFGTLREALENLVLHARSSSRIVGLPAAPAMLALRTLDALHLSPLAPWHYLTCHKPFFFDLSPLRELGWKAKYSNDEMLSESYDWFVTHRGTVGADVGATHRATVRERVLWILRKFS